MIKRLNTFLVTIAVAILGLVAINSPAQAAPPAAKGCQASDRSDVQVNKKADAVTVRGDTSTFGNNYACLTNITVVGGVSTVTFDFIGTCGGGAPRVFLQFDNGASTGENTFDTGTCTMNEEGTGGSVTYTVTKSGTITAFALIHDADNGSTTYSNLVIAGTTINF